MYLARQYGAGGTFDYVIRESYQDAAGRWCCRDLFDLGPDPAVYIRYVGAGGYYFDVAVESALAERDVRVTQDDLEGIFWIFLDPEIRRRVEQFSGRRSRSGKAKRRYSSEELDAMQAPIHPFDRRRLCFLKFGQINMEGLVDRPLEYLNTLLEKSRDEIEQMIDRVEAELRPWNRRGYLYAVFDLPRHFAPRLSRFIPEVQDQELIDRFFLEEVCRLDRDPAYLHGIGPEGGRRCLHPYLLKYLYLFFDLVYRGPMPGARTGGPWSPAPGGPGEDEYLSILGLSAEDFARMGEAELARLFRRKAKDVHPDKGGGHDAFIRLHKAYQALLRKKAW